MDGKTGSTDNKIEKLERMWNVASKFNEPKTEMSFDDYLSLEALMLAFYEEGKLAATGHGAGSSAGMDLSHQCTTVEMADGNDNLVYIQIESGRDGVTQINVQTDTLPLIPLGNPDVDSNNVNNRYAYQNANWEYFETGKREFYGLYGFATKDDPNNMSALGFIVKDVACVQNFSNKLNSDYDWNTPYDKQTKAKLSSEYTDYLSAKGEETSSGAIKPTTNPTGDEAEAKEVIPLIPTHEHESETESGLIVVCILIWVAVMILIIVFFFQYCKEKKGNSAIAYEV